MAMTGHLIPDSIEAADLRDEGQRLRVLELKD
jgi:hypothetical protein